MKQKCTVKFQYCNYFLIMQMIRDLSTDIDWHFAQLGSKYNFVCLKIYDTKNIKYPPYNFISLLWKF